MQLPGLTPKQDAALARKGYRTVAQLRRRLRERGRADPLIASLPAAAQAELVHRPRSGFPLAEGRRVVEKLRACLSFDGPPALASRFEIVGSVRRGRSTIKDLDLLLVLPDRYEGEPRATLPALQVSPRCRPALEILESYASGPRRRSFIMRTSGRTRDGKPVRSNYRVDVFLAYESEKPYALFHYTGSGPYNVRIRAYAKRKGWLLNQYGLFNRETGKRVPGTSSLKTEKQLVRHLGVTWREPSNRQR